jgi:hypothetical protein
VSLPFGVSIVCFTVFRVLGVPQDTTTNDVARRKNFKENLFISRNPHGMSAWKTTIITQDHVLTEEIRESKLAGQFLR